MAFKHWVGNLKRGRGNKTPWEERIVRPFPQGRHSTERIRPRANARNANNQNHNEALNNGENKTGKPHPEPHENVDYPPSLFSHPFHSSSRHQLSDLSSLIMRIIGDICEGFDCTTLCCRVFEHAVLIHGRSRSPRLLWATVSVTCCAVVKENIPYPYYQQNCGEGKYYVTYINCQQLVGKLEIRKKYACNEKPQKATFLGRFSTKTPSPWLERWASTSQQKLL